MTDALGEGASAASGATRTGTVLVVAAIGLAVAIASVTLWATALAVLGAFSLVVGVVHDRARARAAGTLAVLTATLAGAYTGLPAWGVLAGTTAVVVAYDAGERATTLDAQVPTAATSRLELRRAAWTLAVCALVGSLALAVAWTPTTSTPGGAALALVGGVLVALGVRA